LWMGGDGGGGGEGGGSGEGSGSGGGGGEGGETSLVKQQASFLRLPQASSGFLRLEFTSPPSVSPWPRLEGGLAFLRAHALALAGQLQALRYAMYIALTLNRTLLHPRLACYCDRDSSARLAGLLINGCKLPSAESENYLPFTCLPEHVIDSNAWWAAARRHASLASLATLHPIPATLLDRSFPVPEGTGRGVVRGEVRGEVPSSTTVRGEVPSATVHGTGPWYRGQGGEVPAAELLSRLPSPPPRLIELVWPPLASPTAWHPPEPHVTQPVAMAEVDWLLSRGPAGGWCISCAHVAIPTPLLAFGEVWPRTQTAPCRFCLNFSRLLYYRPY